MRRIKVLALVLVLVLGIAGLYALSARDAEAQIAISRVRSVYTVKFLCGTFHGIVNSDGTLREGPVKPGNYQTAINVLNPNSRTISFRKKAVLLFNSRMPPPDGAFEVPMPPGDFVRAKLPPNHGMEIDCADIRAVLLGMPPDPTAPRPFLKGWVEINAGALTRARLSVAAAYTAHGFTPGTPGIPGVCVAGVCVSGSVGAACATDSDCAVAPTPPEPEGFSMQVLPVESSPAF